MTTPTVDTDTDAPPIVVISIDTLRFDVREELESLLAALGDDVVVPDEPRTQGFWTAPAHGSLFTGVHPGDHGLVGWLGDGRDTEIHPDLTTLPTFLSEHHYHCSAVVSHTRVLPESGFGRGFHRFEFNDMSDWVGRPVDAATCIDRLIQWIDADHRSRDSRQFYFAHLFDPHYPYVPPLDRYDVGDIDFEALDTYLRTVADVSDDPEQGYLTQLRSELPVDDETVAALREYYSMSVEYTARQVTRLVDHLEQIGLFDDALIVVTGDHGEEFGERGFYLHTSLNDANIRPFLAVKPPSESSMEPPDRADLIDLLPTLARELGVDPPEQCQGRPWHDESQDGFRTTERLFPDSYNVAVEDGNCKAIHTFESEYPERPTSAQLAAGPVETEFYSLSAVRDGTEPMTADPSAERQVELLATARSFAERAPIVDQQAAREQLKPTQETEERLRDLGYR